ncbi:MAG TPA: SEC-C metal-binding domain-containing protein [Thermoanaerobaculia bacterium]|nr:SEC-C metal-binding domain-containing protein [Thermoanaerobaculia bacterium]
MTEIPTRPPGRNDRCPCGSGRKYKHCCLAKDVAADRAARAEEAGAAAPPPAPEPESEPDATRRRTGESKRLDQPWKRGHEQARGFRKRSGPRNKRGGG